MIFGLESSQPELQPLLGGFSKKSCFLFSWGSELKKKKFPNPWKLFFSIFTYNPIIHYSKKKKLSRIDLEKSSENRKKWFFGPNPHIPNSNRYWFAFWKNPVFTSVGGQARKKKFSNLNKLFFSIFTYNPIIHYSKNQSRT